MHLHGKLQTVSCGPLKHAFGFECCPPDLYKSTHDACSCMIMSHLDQGDVHSMQVDGMLQCMLEQPPKRQLLPGRQSLECECAL